MGCGLGWGRGGGAVVFTKIPRFLTARTAEGAWRLGIMGNKELRLVVGLNYDAVAADLNRMRNIFLVTLPVALLLVGGGGWLVAGRALRPLRRIREMAERVTAQGLDQRIPVAEEDREITRLVEVLNGMMDRLEASFNQATRFSADASHELKTLLAIMQGELENALQTAEPGSSQQQVFSNLLEETQRIKTITRGLLLLAQADAGRLKVALEDVDLSAALEGMVEDARILATDSNLRFDLKIQPGLRVEADRTLLQMAIRNLLGNAVKYNEPGGSVGVTLAADNGQARLTLCNTGAGVPAADQPRIFDRFYRVRGSESVSAEGLGLGLSLAREIVHAHQGQLALKESKPGYTCFTLSLRLHPAR
jgi:signal transduction histidine kinase